MGHCYCRERDSDIGGARLTQLTVNPDLYTKSMLVKDLAELEHIRCGARQALARNDLGGFNNLNVIVAQCDTAEKRCRARYAENATTFGALRKAKFELANATRRGDGPEMARLGKKKRFLSMLVAQILEGTEKPLVLGEVEVEPSIVTDVPKVRKVADQYQILYSAKSAWQNTTLEAVRRVRSCIYV